MTNTGLDLATITALLTEEKTAQAVVDEPTKTFLKPIQVGPLKYVDTSTNCTSLRCGAPTMIRINGIPRCVSHALYELNKLLLDAMDFDYSDCDCKAGMHSKMNIHTSGCPVWTRLKEQSDKFSSESAST